MINIFFVSVRPVAGSQQLALRLSLANTIEVYQGSVAYSKSEQINVTETLKLAFLHVHLK